VLNRISSTEYPQSKMFKGSKGNEGRFERRAGPKRGRSKDNCEQGEVVGKFKAT
jgi:hypothetical protein